MMAGYLVYLAMVGRTAWPPAGLGRGEAAALLRSNSRFIRFSFPADLVNTLSWRLPFVIFPLLFGLEQTGYLALAYTVVATPTRFIGSALGEVFYSHAARQYEETGTCWPIARRIALMLALIGLAGFGLLSLIAEPLFAAVFGPDWIAAATFTRILIPMIAIRFVTSPLSVVFYIAGRQKEDFLWQVGFLLATASALIAGLAFGAAGSIALFSTSGAALYILYFFMIRKYSTSTKTQKIS
jgi:O-antigen/teichoic acid export membrane protein